MYLSLQQGQTVATTRLIILNDTLPEDDEFIYVYITSLTSGVNIARPSVDNGRKVQYSSCNFYFFCGFCCEQVLPIFTVGSSGLEVVHL